MEEYQRSLTIELGHKLYDASRSQKIIENNKKSKMVDKVTEAADKLKIAQLKRLKELQQKLHTSQQTLNGLTTKMFLFPQYYGAALWQIVDKFCEDLNKTKMSEEKIEKPDDHKKRVEELGEQIDEASSQGVAGELDALFMECQIEREEKKKERELKEKLKKIEELKKMKEKYLSIKEKEMAENDKKLAEILKEKVQKQKEVNTLDKELKENRELAQKIGKNLRQMLEEIMKN
ncbi:hypothetical protein GPALN_002104 [Globodera pallida]|nr:hypothetical protein GPALN_002104 [Globodera pallida]